MTVSSPMVTAPTVLIPHRIRNHIRALLRVSGTAASSTAAIPGGLVVTAVFHIAVTAALTALWTSAAEANGGMIAGYSAAAFAWYLATSEAVTISLPQRMIEMVGESITTGRYSTELLRPISPFSLRVVSEIGAAIPRWLVCLVTGSAIAFMMGGAPPNLGALALAPASMLAAMAINVVAQHGFAAAAFWVGEARSAWFLYQKMVFIVGGMLLPLEVLPDALESVARWLPFMAMAYAPARLASGHFEPHLLLIQLAWLVVLTAAISAAFRRGERHLIGHGGRS